MLTTILIIYVIVAILTGIMAFIEMYDGTNRGLMIFTGIIAGIIFPILWAIIPITPYCQLLYRVKRKFTYLDKATK